MACRRRGAVSVLTAFAVACSTGVASAQSRTTQAPASSVVGSPRRGTAAFAPARVLIELRIGNLASVTVPAFRLGEEALVPVAALLRLAEVSHEVGADGTITGTMQPGRTRLVVATTRDTLSYGARRLAPAPELKVARDGELFVGARVLAALLELDVVVDWSELSVTITNPERLPIARRVARQAARESLLRHREIVGGPTRNVPLERPRWDGLVVDYAVTAPGADPLRAGSFSIAAGMNAFGGSLETTASGTGLGPSRVARRTASWTGVWPDNSWVKQIRLGDGISTGIAPQGVRGATITNSPFLRPAHFGVNSFGGVLAPGWQVEAYRGAQLISFDSTDALGHYAVPVTAQYGENLVDFVAYGPSGEMRRFNRMYRVDGELLPARRLEYGVSGGSCAAPWTCTATANADLRYGVSPRWTVRAGYDAFRRDTAASLSHPYASLAGSPTDALGVQLEGVARAHTRGLVRYEPSANLRVAAEYTQFAPSGVVWPLTPPGWRDRWLLSGLVRPRGLTSSVYVEGDASRVETTTGSTVRARLLASAAWRDARLSPYVRLERDNTGAVVLARSFAGLSGSIVPRARWGTMLAGTWMRTMVEVERTTGMTEASVAIARQFERGVRVEAGARWTRSAAMATLLTAIDLAAVRSYTSVLVPRIGAPTASQYLQGSIVLNTATRSLALSPDPSLQRSGVAGRVFLDTNANGLLDAGEPSIPRITVHVGATAASSDSTGWFEVWNLAPFQPAIVAVDTVSLPSPLWTPGFTTMSAVPGPNRFVLVDVPIAPGGVVEGRVLLETGTGREGLGHASLTLVERRTGARRPLETFTDGDFVAVAVRPGHYDVLVDARLLTRLEAAAVPVSLVVPANPDGAAVRGIEVILRRAAPAALDSATPAPAHPQLATATQRTSPYINTVAPTPPVATPRVEPRVEASQPSRARAGAPRRTRHVVSYTVRRHDTLRRIARRLLGSERRWPEIYRLNLARIRRPDLIRPGQRLRIRAQPRGNERR